MNIITKTIKTLPNGGTEGFSFITTDAVPEQAGGMNIIELAREAGFVVQRDEWVLQTMLRTFYALVREQALEEAAGVCEEVHDRYPTDIFPDGASVDAQSAKMARITANNCAAAIRALKEKT